MIRLQNWLPVWAALALSFLLTSMAAADDIKLKLRYIREIGDGTPRVERRIKVETWPAAETAVIVCDVWDYHHCLNAVRRLEEFAPRLDAVLKEARRCGAIIIHAPSDCMDAYVDHPARKRATAVRRAEKLPQDIEHWCSRIAAEENADYPLDQSDGGEDDEPHAHAEWAAKLKALGRNPNMPWKMQSPLIAIDDERDYISDRGDEVWSILEAKGIRRVILTGVHANMCVLGRPFGLRQMVRGGKQVALMRDMTDCMYNPARWPYVDHFTGNDLLITHVERYVCPTITSDQLLGGEPFQFKGDNRTNRDQILNPILHPTPPAFEKHWVKVKIPLLAISDAAQAAENEAGSWFRCAVRLPQEWSSDEAVSLQLGKPAGECRVWLNGHAATRNKESQGAEFCIPSNAIIANEANLLVVHLAPAKGGMLETPMILAGKQRLSLRGSWQMRLGDDPSWSNIPLPAKFGAAPDMLFEGTLAR